MPEIPLPALDSATVCLNLRTEVGITLDWHACVGLRGFMGRRLDDVHDSLRDMLLPIFHRQHEKPAPFRIVLEQSDPENGVHQFRFLTFGSNAKYFLTCFTDLLKGASGELHHEGRNICFNIPEIGSFDEGKLYFPGQEGAVLADIPPFVEVISTSPFFSKTESELLFSHGQWPELLAIRFADLAGIRRQLVCGKLPQFSTKADVQFMAFRISFGGVRRTQKGFFFRARFSHPDAIVWNSLELLRCLGLGKNCAYGAGCFRVEPRNEGMSF